MLDSDRNVPQAWNASAAVPIETLRFGSLQIDTARRAVTVQGQNVGLTAKEFDLLLHLARRPGRVFTREQLIAAVWGASYGGYQHAVSSMVNRLRGKIERLPGDHRYLETAWGIGYCFQLPDDC